MKIEIGESLLHTYLRQVRGCQIAQTNWKKSERTDIAVLDNEQLRFFEQLKLDVGFRPGQQLSQIVRQTEADVVGIRVEGNQNDFFFADSAFHLGGLGYGDSETNTGKIIRKMFSAGLALFLEFKSTRGTLIFASPKVRGNCTSYYERASFLSNKFAEIGLDYKVELIFNADYKSKILLPIIANHAGYHDTSELFMRSLKMLDLFGLLNHQIPEQNEESDEQSMNESDPVDLAEVVTDRAIGQDAKMFFKTMATKNRLMQIAEKDLHLSGMTMLKPVAGNADLKAEAYIGRYRRFYTDLLQDHEGNSFLLCNNWTNNHRELLNDLKRNFDH